MPARIAIVAMLLAAATALTGCHSAPTLRVIDAEITEQTDDGFVVTFHLEGLNPNDDPLPLRRVNYSLSLDGRRVFEGVRSPEATLPRRGVQRFSLPVATPRDVWTPEQLGAGASYTLRGELTYLAPGAFAEVLFDAGVRRPTVSFRSSGEFSALESIPDEPAAPPE
ncbi:MAG: hypothetical protein EA376_03350 [Phycisphaeraceae bacterium]|nr:MAG: hypothetical protein EA376_03350 [Phycisphaeraceae bacterium]